MGWLDRKKDEKLPTRLEGKTPEQVAKELEEADALKVKLELAQKAQQEADEKVSAISSEFETVKARLADIDARNKKPPDTPPAELTADGLLEDPKKSIESTMLPTTSLAVQTAAATARILAQQQLDNADMASGGKVMDGRLFRAWGAEIDAEARKYGPQQLMRQDAWIGIFYYLKGQHADELANPETRKKKYNFLEPSTNGAPPPADTRPKDGPESLTDEEKRVADRMGVTHENYAKRKKAMHFVGA